MSCPICDGDHGEGQPCRPHWEARLTGMEDARTTGEPTHHDEWPSGTYGHADYWLGYYDDQSSRR